MADFGLYAALKNVTNREDGTEKLWSVFNKKKNKLYSHCCR